METNRWIYYTWVTIVLLLSSCNDFLDELPSKNTSLPVETTEQLDALLAKYEIFCEEQNRAAFCGNDDFEFPLGLYELQPLLLPGPNSMLQTYLWDYTNLMKSGDEFWQGNGYDTGEFTKIFRANMVLESLDNVDGTEEDKARLKAEAHFLRAYTYWGLANTYCLPYVAENVDELGLPIKRSTSYEESAVRVSLKETYQFIESDLTEALKCITPLVQDGKNKHWRANTAAVHAFAARYYLHKEDYEQALYYADEVLKEYDVLVDYNTEMREEDLTGMGFKVPITYEQDFYTNFEKRIAWKEMLYMRYLSCSQIYSYFPSEELLGLYDKEHDLRYRYHFVEDYVRIWYGCDYEMSVYMFFSSNQIPTGPTTAEMYLVKAECQARLGQYEEAMRTVNLLRAKRMEPGEWVYLHADNVEDAVLQILDERRREMPFAQRWYDLRRLNTNAEAFDDAGEVIRQFYPVTETQINTEAELITYTLKKGSRRYALPIPENEIELSNGALEQNVY